MRKPHGCCARCSRHDPASADAVRSSARCPDSYRCRWLILRGWSTNRMAITLSLGFYEGTGCCLINQQSWQRSVNAMVQGDRRSDRMSASRHVIKVDPFVGGFDMNLIEPLSRSIRLNGFATCLRLDRSTGTSLAAWPRSIIVQSARCCRISIERCICVMAA